MGAKAGIAGVDTRSFVSNLIPVVSGLLVFIVIFNVWFKDKDTKFDEMALGKETQSYYAAIEDVPIHCKDVSDAEDCIEGWRERGSAPVVLWLGNSQVHAINQMKDNDKTGAFWLFQKLEKLGFELITFSQPNASFQEHYVLFEYLAKKFNVKALILPAVFDDTRNAGIRDGIALGIEEPDVLAEMAKSKVGLSLINEIKSENGKGDLAGLNNTNQEHVEAALTQWLTEYLPLWSARPEMRGQILNFLYRLRNTIFGINAQSKRPIIKARYDNNMAACSTLLQSAKEKNIETLVYIAPIRDDVEIPYEKTEYNLFKTDVQERARDTEALYINLEHLVPASLWGSKDATNVNGQKELDFMHFQGEGHKIIANELYRLLIVQNLVRANDI